MEERGRVPLQPELQRAQTERLLRYGCSIGMQAQMPVAGVPGRRTRVFHCRGYQGAYDGQKTRPLAVQCHH
jgi:hypothetical protein